MHFSRQKRDTPSKVEKRKTAPSLRASTWPSRYSDLSVRTQAACDVSNPQLLNLHSCSVRNCKSTSYVQFAYWRQVEISFVTSVARIAM